MGGEQRKGRWRPARRTNAIAVMGGIDIDLREAELADGAEILAVPVMGAVSIVVPEGVSVEMSGFALMGGNSGPDDKVLPLPNSPIVRVRAFSLMGGVVVERKPARSARRWTLSVAQLAGQPHDHRGGRGHVLHRRPLAHRVELVAAGEEVRGRQRRGRSGSSRRCRRGSARARPRAPRRGSPRAALLDDLRERLEVAAHVRVLVLDLDLEPGARLVGDDLLGGPPHERDVLLEQLVVEVARDQLDRRARGRDVDVVGVDEPLAVRASPPGVSCRTAARPGSGPRARAALTSLPVAQPGWTSTP